MTTMGGLRAQLRRLEERRAENAPDRVLDLLGEVPIGMLFELTRDPLSPRMEALLANALGAAQADAGARGLSEKALLERGIEHLVNLLRQDAAEAK